MNLWNVENASANETVGQFKTKVSGTYLRYLKYFIKKNNFSVVKT